MAEALVGEYLVIPSSLYQFVYFSLVLREREDTKTKHSAPLMIALVELVPALFSRKFLKNYLMEEAKIALSFLPLA